MSDVREQLGAARAALQDAEETLGEYQSLLGSWTEQLEAPDAAGLSAATQDVLEKGTKDVRDMIEFQSNRVEGLRDAVLTLEVHQPEYPQYAAAWLGYGHLRQTHIDQIGAGEAPTDEARSGSEEQERELAALLGFPFLNEYIDWAKTVRHPVGLDLSTWPHTLPDPPDEPPEAVVQLKALLDDPDEAVRAFGHVALTALANARAVRDYKGGRTLS